MEMDKAKILETGASRRPTRGPIPREGAISCCKPVSTALRLGGCDRCRVAVVRAAFVVGRARERPSGMRSLCFSRSSLPLPGFEAVIRRFRCSERVPAGGRERSERPRAGPGRRHGRRTRGWTHRRRRCLGADRDARRQGPDVDLWIAGIPYTAGTFVHTGTCPRRQMRYC